MTRKLVLTAVVALGAGLMIAAASQSLAQDPAPPPPAGSAAPAPADNAAEPIGSYSATPDPNQPTYPVPAPAGDSSGEYLPAVVGGYVKSTTNCVVVGCDNGPDAGATDTPGSPPPPGSQQPAPLPPANPGPTGAH